MYTVSEKKRDLFVHNCNNSGYIFVTCGMIHRDNSGNSEIAILSSNTNTSITDDDVIMKFTQGKHAVLAS